MSKFKKIFSSLFGGGEDKAPPLPVPKIPAVPAPSRREDTGAQIVVGSDKGKKNKRVSGRRSGSGSGSSSGDVIGGLGRGGGLSI